MSRKGGDRLSARRWTQNRTVRWQPRLGPKGAWYSPWKVWLTDEKAEQDGLTRGPYLCLTRRGAIREARRQRSINERKKRADAYLASWKSDE